MDFPTLVRMLRGKWSREEFSSIIGASKSTIWHWEKGNIHPKVTLLEDLAAATGCTIMVYPDGSWNIIRRSENRHESPANDSPEH